MREERARILEMLREGKISVEEADQLLDALGDGRPEPAERFRPSRLRVRITDLETGTIKTDVNLPFGAWGLFNKLSRTKLGRRLGGLALHEVQRAARGGTTGHIVDITNDDEGERVEVFFE